MRCSGCGSTKFVGNQINVWRNVIRWDTEAGFISEEKSSYGDDTNVFCAECCNPATDEEADAFWWNFYNRREDD